MQVECPFERREPMQAASRQPTRSVTRCRVCGFAEVRTDEAVDRDLVMLAECPRCEYRWTSCAQVDALVQRSETRPLLARRLQRVPVWVPGEAAPAA